MALDFPASPTVGQKFPASPTAGIPNYVWDGAKWTTPGSVPVAPTIPHANTIPFTPVGNIASNTVQLALQEVDSEKLAIAGGTVTGSLTTSTDAGAATTVVGTFGVQSGNVYFLNTAAAQSTMFLGLANTILWRFAAATNNWLYITDADGSAGVAIGQDQVAWTGVSDARLPQKQNARTLEGILPRLDKFRLVEYDEGYSKLGIIAQEFIEVAPQLVYPGDDDVTRTVHGIMDEGAWKVASSEAGYVALQMCKELAALVTELRAEIELLKAPV